MGCILTARLSERLRKLRYVTLRQIPPHRQRGGGQRLQLRRHGLAPRGRAQCGREQRGHPRRLAYSSDFSQRVALVKNIPTLASRLNGLSIVNVAGQRRRLLALLRPKPPAVRGQALAGVTCRRRQKKYESPQSKPVAAAQPHTSGPSPTER